MNSALVTGTSGFLGRTVLAVLNKNALIARDLNNYVKPVKRVDITSGFNLEPIDGPEVVVHSAGKAHSIPRSKEEEKAFYSVNFDGTKNLCRALEGLKALPKSFIFISTVSVYGLDEGTGITEQYPLKGESPYARSKISAEQWLQDWAKNNNVILGILRLPLLAGPNPPGNLGAMIKAIKKGLYVNVGGGNARRSMVMAEDVAAIIPHIAKVGGIYNLCDGYHPSYRELDELITTQLRKRPSKNIPLWAGRTLGRIGDLLGKNAPVTSDKVKKMITDLTIDDSKARNEIGWDPRRVLDAFRIH